MTDRPGLVKKLQEKYKDVNLNTDISGSREKSNISGLNLLRTLDTALSTEGYSLVSLTVGSLRVNLPIHGDTGDWQSGSTIISFRLHQLI